MLKMILMVKYLRELSHAQQGNSYTENQAYDLVTSCILDLNVFFV